MTRSRSESWPKPKQIVEGELEDVPPFPTSFLPSPVDRFVEDVSHRMQCPPEYVAIPLLAGTIAAIGNKARLKLKLLDDWTERPVTWAMIVGSSGTHKTPAFKAALRPIFELDESLQQQFDDEIAEWNEAADLAKIREKVWKKSVELALKEGDEPPPKPEEATPPPRPTLRRITVQDATQEALVIILRDNPNGALSVDDELAGLVGRLNQYRGGKGADRQFYLAAYSGTHYRKDRAGGEATYLPSPLLHICGGIQPIALPLVFSSGETDGLEARFSFAVWPDQPGKKRYIDRTPDHQAAEAVERMIEKLYHDDTPSRLQLSPAAKKLFAAWWEKLQSRIQSEEAVMRAHLSKYPTAFATLVIFKHKCSADGSKDIVSKATVASVIKFIDEYLEPHARRIYGYVNAGKTHDHTLRIAKHLLDSAELVEFTRREIRRHHWSGLTDNVAIDRALDELQRRGWIRPKTQRRTKGRRTIRYEVNPKIRTTRDLT